MNRFAGAIVKHKKLVIAVFLAVTAICIVLQFFVKVNYNMVDYLPSKAQSTKALSIMEGEFTDAMPNTKVMVRDLSVTEAVDYKKKLLAVDGVEQVMWLDDMVDIKKPLEWNDTDMVEGFYKDGCALYQVTIEKGREQSATAALQELIGGENAVGGDAPDLATLQSSAGTEAGGAMLLLVPIIILILTLATTSWADPVLFLINIGVAVFINMGTGIFLENISFMSFSVSPILQLACSLDYGIFLMASFSANRKKYADIDTAMRVSIKESLSTIAASAMTTLFGFLALVFMNFQIGADLGICLAKGIVISFITATVFLPALALSAYKLIDRFQHRPLMPSFANVHRVLTKVSIPVIILVFLLIVPCFLGQGNTNFIYGNENLQPTNRTSRDSAMINEKFGKNTIMAVLVPRGDVVKEKKLGDDIEKINHVTGVMSYANTVGEAIPSEYLSEDTISQFYSRGYARLIVYTDTAAEGEESFGTVRQIQAKAKEYYGNKAYSLGQSANLYDMKALVEQDNLNVNIIAIVAIFVVLLITFRSAILPILLLLTIEAGIWINLSIPYFQGESINFIGYLVLSTVQLGATVDYAILLTTHHMRNRQNLLKHDAIHLSLGETFKSVLISGATLSLAGFILYFTSSNPSIQDIGLLLGRGTLLSVIMVTCFLPALLTWLDVPIGKVTLKANFLRKERKKLRSGGIKHEKQTI